MDPRAQAHEAFDRREWQAAYDAFQGLDDLTADDHDALAESAHWLGLPTVSIDSYGKAYELHLRAGAPRRAALSAFNRAIYAAAQRGGAGGRMAGPGASSASRCCGGT